MNNSIPTIFTAFRTPETYALEHFHDNRCTEANITVNGHELPLRLDISNHSPTGFEWGYQGSGPAQTALAILAFLYGDVVAERYHNTFMHEVISSMPKAGWQLSDEFIDKWLVEKQGNYNDKSY